MNELRLFLHAVRFLTIVPTPVTASIEPDWLPRCAKYLPLVGILVGVLSAAVLLVADRIWTGVLPALLAVAASVLITGALHEDGLADTADGLGGGRTREARLAIMKDSRVGTYGALALGFSLALRVGALAVIPPYVGAAALLAAHGGGRFAAVAVMMVQPYARDLSAGKVLYASEPPHTVEFWAATMFALLASAPLALMAPPALVAGVMAGAVLAALLALVARKLIEGYTGDVLGAVEQLYEVGLLLTVSAAVRV